MDQWDFKKWRKKLGINQVVAEEMLGLSRGAVQYWESDIRPVPRAVELAYQELLRRWKQRAGVWARDHALCRGSDIAGGPSLP
jgi:hypothetical protein